VELTRKTWSISWKVTLLLWLVGALFSFYSRQTKQHQQDIAQAVADAVKQERERAAREKEADPWKNAPEVAPVDYDAVAKQYGRVATPTGYMPDTPPAKQKPTEQQLYRTMTAEEAKVFCGKLSTTIADSLRLGNSSMFLNFGQNNGVHLSLNEAQHFNQQLEKLLHENQENKPVVLVISRIKQKDGSTAAVIWMDLLQTTETRQQ